MNKLSKIIHCFEEGERKAGQKALQKK